MGKRNESEPTSGFVIPSEITKSGGFTDFTNIPSRGVFQLTRAKRNGRWWMLKGLKVEYRHDGVYRAFLEKEFEIAGQLQHPMVVAVYSLEEVEELGLCIVMEWVEGTTLGEWLATGGHTRKERRHIAGMLLETLIYVHSRQTQHRDLKPSNIMVTHNGQYLKMIDFGLSDPRTAVGLDEFLGGKKMLCSPSSTLSRHFCHTKRLAACLALAPAPALFGHPCHAGGCALSFQPLTHPTEAAIGQ